MVFHASSSSGLGRPFHGFSSSKAPWNRTTSYSTTPLAGAAEESAWAGQDEEPMRQETHSKQTIAPHTADPKDVFCQHPDRRTRPRLQRGEAVLSTPPRCTNDSNDSLGSSDRARRHPFPVTTVSMRCKCPRKPLMTPQTNDGRLEDETYWLSNLTKVEGGSTSLEGKDHKRGSITC
jgi:hypothetical protein